MKKYDIYISGSEKIATVKATCISKACKNFIETLGRKATYTLVNTDYATIRYTDNFSVCSNYVVMGQ